MDRHLRIISWNVQHTMTRAGARIALLEDLDHRLGRWDVLCAQEVMPAMFDRLVSAFGGQAAYFFDQPGEREDGARSAAMLLARPPWSLVDTNALGDAPSPLRTATAVLARHGHRHAAVASGALPPASMTRWGIEAKVAQAEAFRRWVESQPTLPTLIGLDANGPLADTLDGVTFHDERERILFGFPTAPLTDAYRAALTDGDLRRLRRLRPEGPLAVTHMAGGNAPRRYDHILTTGCDIIDAGHVIGDAFAAGSDHALVHALVRLPE